MTIDSPLVVKINGTFSKWALGIFASLIMLAVGWSVTTMAEHDARLIRLMEFRAATEANRFTTADAILLQREMRDYHEARTPPPEILLQLQTLDERIDVIEAHISGHIHEDYDG